MFGSMKRAMVAGAIVAVGALAGPAMASAGPAWTQGGTLLSGPPTAMTAEGDLTFTWTAGLSVTCHTEVSGELWNTTSPQAGLGSFDDVTFDYPCPTNIPNCYARLFALGLPWSVSLPTYRAEVAGFDYTVTYDGSGCPPGLPLNVPTRWSGTLNPAVSSGFLTFDGGAQNSLSGALGVQEVTGELEITSPEEVSTTEV